jgi:putative Mg2+ transporter-C (MgtC) family protein
MSTTANLAPMLGALLLGWLVGYERYFSGRASGSQVYCVVCTTSCAITLLGGSEPTHIIGAVLQGIGFLGAGIIVQNGLNVRGLTTAASVWASSAIGILVGVGWYPAAIALTALFVISVSVVPRIERSLPVHSTMAVSVRFRETYTPVADSIQRYVAERGLLIPPDSLSITSKHGRFELQCLMVADKVTLTEAMGRIVNGLNRMAEVESFTVTPSSRA